MKIFFVFLVCGMVALFMGKKKKNAVFFSPQRTYSPAEVGFQAASLRKKTRYDDPGQVDSLLSRIRANKWSASLITVEVGTLGSLPKSRLTTFTSLGSASVATVNAFLLETSMCALEHSQMIFCQKDNVAMK
eukprot:Lithocolla_globosa_v1_NODE_1618_length_2443_cov_45.760988.p2 type:complete len:132 gc:universal NODE_1618_length_2443_cov_45.760988:2023-2418(+)